MESVMAVISVVTVTNTLLSPNFFRVCRSRLRSLKIGFWQHSDSDAISNRNRLLDANCLGQWSLNANLHDGGCSSRSNAKVSIVVGWSLVCELESRQFRIAKLGHCRTMDGWTGKFVSLKYSSRRIFGINLVFKNGRERAERECRR